MNLVHGQPIPSNLRHPAGGFHDPADPRFQRAPGPLVPKMEGMIDSVGSALAGQEQATIAGADGSLPVSLEDYTLIVAGSNAYTEGIHDGVNPHIAKPRQHRDMMTQLGIIRVEKKAEAALYAIYLKAFDLGRCIRAPVKT